MARYYVEKDGGWNIFSTVVDDFLFDEFICLDALKARLLYERFKELTEDMDSLLTNNPRVNVMTYSEAIDRKQADTSQTDCDTCRHYKLACELFSEVCKYEPTTQNSNLTFEIDTPQTEICDTCKYRSSNVFGNWCVGRDTCDRYEADTPQKELTAKCLNCHNAKACKEKHWDGCIYEPQTDCGWK